MALHTLLISWWPCPWCFSSLPHGGQFCNRPSTSEIPHGMLIVVVYSPEGTLTQSSWMTYIVISAGHLVSGVLERHHQIPPKWPFCSVEPSVDSNLMIIWHLSLLHLPAPHPSVSFQQQGHVEEFPLVLLPLLIIKLIILWLWCMLGVLVFPYSTELWHGP